MSTIALKLENQTGGDGQRRKNGVTVRDGLIESIDKDGLKSVDDVTNWVNQKMPKYVGSGVDHALRGTETFLRLERADPKSDLHRAWQRVKADATMNPGSLDADSTLGKDYAAVKDQFRRASGQHHGKHDAVGDQVTALQTKLAKLGYSGPDGEPLVADGRMGSGTQQAVKAFQRDNHLKDDGKAGPATMRIMNDKLKEQAAAATPQLEAAIQDSPLFKQAQSALQKIDVQFGRKSDQLTDNAAAVVAVAAQRAGLTRIDHLELGGPDNTKIFAVQGKPGTAHSKVFDVQTVEAMNTPMAQSSQAFCAAQQARQLQQATQPTAQQAVPALSP